MKPVLTIGDLNADLILTGLSDHPRYGREVLVRGCRMTLGGSAAIFACGLAALGHPVRFAGVLGRDATGDWLVDLMRRRGVNVSGVRRDSKVGTGIAVAFTQRRQMQAQHVKPEIQVAPELSLLDTFFQRAIAGSNHPHVG